MPYWPAYEEPRRSRVEAHFREEERKWQKSVMRDATLNLMLALVGPLMIVEAAIGLIILVW